MLDYMLRNQRHLAIFPNVSEFKYNYISISNIIYQEFCFKTEPSYIKGNSELLMDKIILQSFNSSKINVRRMSRGFPYVVMHT